MYNKDAEKIAKLYMEYTVNEVDNDDFFVKTIEGILMRTMLGKKFPFVFAGETPSTDGEEEELTVAGQPIQDYQIKNIAHAVANETISTLSDERNEEGADRVLNMMIKFLAGQMAKYEMGGKLTQDYNKQSFNPNALSNPSKKTPRFQGDNEGGIE